MHPEDIAKVCHAANRAVRLALGERDTGSWEEVPEHIRQSVRRDTVTQTANDR